MNEEIGECWHCMNAVCRKEIFIAYSEATAGNRPQCSCGAEMKKEYTPPVFRYLEFLQLEQHSLAEQVARKD